MNNKGWRYKNTIILVASLFVLYFIADTEAVRNFIVRVGELGYFGVFLVGIFFVSIFTVAPASLVLFHLAKELDPLSIAIFAGIGAMIGDYVIFRFLRDHVFEELSPLFSRIGGSSLSKIFRTPYFTWLLPLAGAIIIASPFPDEVGLGLMGLSKIKTWQFVLVTFLLNSVGIFILVSLARLN
jgi:hypothetical protein